MFLTAELRRVFTLPAVVAELSLPAGRQVEAQAGQRTAEDFLFFLLLFFLCVPLRLLCVLCGLNLVTD